MSAPVADLVARIASLREARKVMLERHRSELGELDRSIEDAIHRRDLAAVGLPDGMLDIAKQVIQIRGRVAESAEGALAAAIDDLAAGCPILRERYIGAKRYEGFHQREDHEYGYGPKHGSIVFAVELTSEARQRLRAVGATLTAEEREAAVRWLLAEKAAST